MGLRIEFYSDHGIFYSGDFVRGSVVLNLDQPEKVSELKLKIKGKKVCRWSQQDDYYRGKEIIFRQIINLVGGRSTRDDPIEFPEGEHKIGFQVPIPAAAASSYESMVGSVKYTAKVTMKRPGVWKFDQNHKRFFDVRETCDLNLIPHLEKPSKAWKCNELFVLFVKVGVVDVKVNLPQTGYVPGQTVPLKCHIRNSSSVTVYNVRFSLGQMVTYKTTQSLDGKKRRYDKELVVEEKYSGKTMEGVPKGREKYFDVQIPIPDNFPTSSDSRVPTVIEIRHVINVKVYLSGLHENFKMSVPIHIGTIPLKPQEEYSMQRSIDNRNYLDINNYYADQESDSNIDWN